MKLQGQYPTEIDIIQAAKYSILYKFKPYSSNWENMDVLNWSTDVVKSWKSKKNAIAILNRLKRCTRSELIKSNNGFYYLVVKRG